MIYIFAEYVCMILDTKYINQIIFKFVKQHHLLMNTETLKTISPSEAKEILSTFTTPS